MIEREGDGRGDSENKRGVTKVRKSEEVRARAQKRVRRQWKGAREKQEKKQGRRKEN